MTADERFFARVAQIPNGCWLWTGGKSGVGYGQFWFDGRLRPAHRWSYERFVGPVPENLTVHHTCEVKACVNPEHLQPLTQRDNVMASDGPARRNSLKTHCSAGHLLVPPNMYKNKYGWRVCRACHRRWGLEAYARRKKTRSSSGPKVG